MIICRTVRRSMRALFFDSSSSIPTSALNGDSALNKVCTSASLTAAPPDCVIAAPRTMTWFSACCGKTQFSVSSSFGCV